MDGDQSTAMDGDERPLVFRHPERPLQHFLFLLLAVLAGCLLSHALKYRVHYNGFGWQHLTVGGFIGEWLYALARFYPLGCGAICAVLLFHVSGPWKTRFSLAVPAFIMLLAAVAYSNTLGHPSFGNHVKAEVIYWQCLVIPMALVFRHMHRGCIALRNSPTSHRRVSPADWVLVVAVSLLLLGAFLLNHALSILNIEEVSLFSVLVFQGAASTTAAALVAHRMGLSPNLRRWHLRGVMLALFVLFMGLYWSMTILCENLDSSGLGTYRGEPFLGVILPGMVGAASGIVLANLHVIWVLRHLGFRWCSSRPMPTES